MTVPFMDIWFVCGLISFSSITGSAGWIFSLLVLLQSTPLSKDDQSIGEFQRLIIVQLFTVNVRTSADPEIPLFSVYVNN